MLEYLAAEHDRPYEGDEMLFEILHFNFWNIKPIDIAKLSVHVASKQFGADKTSISQLYQPDYTESIFVVGDDDQSIYRFQGANVENMLGFANTFTEQLKTVVLTNNYRSVQPILDVSKIIIDKNTQR